MSLTKIHEEASDFQSVSGGTNESTTLVTLTHLHWLVAVATPETPCFSEEPVAVATGGGYP